MAIVGGQEREQPPDQRGDLRTLDPAHHCLADDVLHIVVAQHVGGGGKGLGQLAGDLP